VAFTSSTSGGACDGNYNHQYLVLSTSALLEGGVVIPDFLE
jgi:hypothetical protein